MSCLSPWAEEKAYRQTLDSLRQSDPVEAKQRIQQVYCSQSI